MQYEYMMYNKISPAEDAEMEDTSRRMKVRGNVADAFGLCHCIYNYKYSMWPTTTGTLSVYGPAGRCRPIDGLYIHFEAHGMVVEGLWSI